jgi:hypothetical protein
MMSINWKPQNDGCKSRSGKFLNLQNRM